MTVELRRVAFAVLDLGVQLLGVHGVVQQRFVDPRPPRRGRRIRHDDTDLDLGAAAAPGPVYEGWVTYLGNG